MNTSFVSCPPGTSSNTDVFRSPADACVVNDRAVRTLWGTSLFLHFTNTMYCLYRFNKRFGNFNNGRPFSELFLASNNDTFLYPMRFAMFSGSVSIVGSVVSGLHLFTSQCFLIDPLLTCIYVVVWCVSSFEFIMFNQHMHLKLAMDGAGGKLTGETVLAISRARIGVRVIIWTAAVAGVSAPWTTPEVSNVLGSITLFAWAFALVLVDTTVAKRGRSALIVRLESTIAMGGVLREDPVLKLATCASIKKLRFQTRYSAIMNSVMSLALCVSASSHSIGSYSLCYLLPMFAGILQPVSLLMRHYRSIVDNGGSSKKIQSVSKQVLSLIKAGSSVAVSLKQATVHHMQSGGRGLPVVATAAVGAATAIPVPPIQPQPRHPSLWLPRRQSALPLVRTLECVAAKTRVRQIRAQASLAARNEGHKGREPHITNTAPSGDTEYVNLRPSVVDGKVAVSVESDLHEGWRRLAALAIDMTRNAESPFSPTEKACVDRARGLRVAFEHSLSRKPVPSPFPSVELEIGMVAGRNLSFMRATGIILATPAEISAFRFDVPRWIGTISLERPSERSYITYTSVRSPPPLVMRDFVTMTVRAEEEHGCLLVANMPHCHASKPVQRGWVRGLYEDVMVLTPVNGTSTDCEWLLRVDVGGLVPAKYMNRALIQRARNLVEMQEFFSIWSAARRRSNFHMNSTVLLGQLSYNELKLQDLIERGYGLHSLINDKNLVMSLQGPQQEVETLFNEAIDTVYMRAHGSVRATASEICRYYMLSNPRESFILEATDERFHLCYSVWKVEPSVATRPCDCVNAVACKLLDGEQGAVISSMPGSHASHPVRGTHARILFHECIILKSDATAVGQTDVEQVVSVVFCGRMSKHHAQAFTRKCEIVSVMRDFFNGGGNNEPNESSSAPRVKWEPSVKVVVARASAMRESHENHKLFIRIFQSSKPLLSIDVSYIEARGTMFIRSCGRVACESSSLRDFVFNMLNHGEHISDSTLSVFPKTRRSWQMEELSGCHSTVYTDVYLIGGLQMRREFVNDLVWLEEGPSQFSILNFPANHGVYLYPQITFEEIITISAADDGQSRVDQILRINFQVAVAAAFHSSVARQFEFVSSLQKHYWPVSE
jgi:hypothetical protein